jgi:predicted ArsR family transcriptional regulator
MKPSGWRERLLDSTRGQILALLRIANRTVGDLAEALHLTDNAVRAHLLSLERDSLVERVGIQRGVRKPHASYGLTSEADYIFPKAYGPLLDLLLSVVSKRLSPQEVKESMREMGRTIAGPHMETVRGRSPEERIKTALQMLEDLGGMARLDESRDRRFIRGNGCPLSAVTAHHPVACLIAESLLSEIIGAPIKECCTHGELPNCCFEIAC